MYVNKLIIKNFRSYNELVLNLTNGTNVFVGDNAQGKTNILESIYYSSIGKSHRTNRDKELITWNKDDAYIRVDISKKRLDKKIEMKIFKEGKKGININSVKINRLSELVGVLNVVMFSPEDLSIIKDSPSYRRKFLDIELCKLYPKYYYNLAAYKKVLAERNNVLKKFNCNLDILDIYDIKLSEFGTYIIEKRLEYINRLNDKALNIHKDITSNKEIINFAYLSNIKEDAVDIKAQMYNSLLKNRKKDFERKITSIGPHRDDFATFINNIDVKTYGSQGQQRTSVLSMKFASVQIIKDITGEYPLLLLDDVLSELDISRQKYILNSISNVQTLITCTGINNIKKYLNSSVDIKIFEVKTGKITDITN
ncbi:DNA replication/repair protein RecF [Clostridium senegalense]|uniref:DNA replication and repair protein RecF n=1 Tax=Clostridium senegalense TaxID=1465809 RepID=A0A6M0H0T5_9CLOT|nr:DNA replication/repair protein RecF [Clostridium senegalense]NEU04396.1 DNA replication/repair protein RecF [Clostridium senegalense]